MAAIMPDIDIHRFVKGFRNAQLMPVSWSDTLESLARLRSALVASAPALRNLSLALVTCVLFGGLRDSIDMKSLLVLEGLNVFV